MELSFKIGGASEELAEIANVLESFQVILMWCFFIIFIVLTYKVICKSMNIKKKNAIRNEEKHS